MIVIIGDLDRFMDIVLVLNNVFFVFGVLIEDVSWGM